MQRRKFLIMISLLLAVVALSWGKDQVSAQQAGSSNDQILHKQGKITPAERKAAAKRARAIGLKPGVAGAHAAPPVGAAPADNRK